jgi:hypothetical protein
MLELFMLFAVMPRVVYRCHWSLLGCCRPHRLLSGLLLPASVTVVADHGPSFTARNGWFVIVVICSVIVRR